MRFSCKSTKKEDWFLSLHIQKEEIIMWSPAEFVNLLSHKEMNSL